MVHGVRAAALCAVLLVAAGSTLPATAAVARRTVTVQADNFRFCAGRASSCDPTAGDYVTTVRVGTRVRWTYRDAACDVLLPCPGHDVIFPGGRHSALVKSDGAVILTLVFRRAGAYRYYCGVHRSFGMTGTVVVRPARR